MQVQTFQLWEEQQQVTLTAYLPTALIEGQTEDSAKPAVLICPGGAYLYTSEREAEPVALRFASLGYQAFVLHYNTYYGRGAFDPAAPPPANPLVKFPQPIFDAAKAILTIRERAEEWNVNPNQIAVAGFSAGGHLAASLGVHWQDEFLRKKLNVDSEMLKPNALILSYALLDSKLALDLMNEEEKAKYSDMITLEYKALFGSDDAPTNEDLERLSPAMHISEHTPPAFIWHTSEDDLVLSANSLQFAMGLSAHRIPYELHVFEKGVHGLSLADRTTATNPLQISPEAAEWVYKADRFLQRRFEV